MKTKTQISFAVTAKLISAFVFATLIVQSLYLLNQKFQASSYLLWLYSPVCVKPGRKPRRPVFSQRGSILPNCEDWNCCRYIQNSNSIMKFVETSWSCSQLIHNKTNKMKCASENEQIIVRMDQSLCSHHEKNAT